MRSPQSSAKQRCSWVSICVTVMNACQLHNTILSLLNSLSSPIPWEQQSALSALSWSQQQFHEWNHACNFAKCCSPNYAQTCIIACRVVKTNKKLETALHSLWFPVSTSLLNLCLCHPHLGHRTCFRFSSLRTLHEWRTWSFIFYSSWKWCFSDKVLIDDRT